MATKERSSQETLLAPIMLWALALLTNACVNSVPREDYAKMRISELCQAEKRFFKATGRYGTKAELLAKELIRDDRSNVNFWGGNSVGYTSDIKPSMKTFLAMVVPSDFSQGKVFYADEKGVIKQHSGNTNVQPDDPVCVLEEGCYCFDD